MASMLLRAFRYAARAAPLAASVAARCAAVAASGSVGAAASNRLLRRFPSASGPFGRALSSDHHDVPVVPPQPYNYNHQRNVEYFADTMDIKSDEALWGTLYERWCKTFGEGRDQKEMHRHFEEFKNSVLFVDRTNEDSTKLHGLYVRYAIRKMLDGKCFELMAFKAPFFPPKTKIFLRAGKDLETSRCLPWAF